MKPRSAAIDWLLKTAGIAAAYFLFARMALLIPIHQGQATPVWPAAGIALAGVLLLGRGIWPGIFLGSVAATLPIYLDTTSFESLLLSFLSPSQFAGSAVLEALLGAYLVQRGSGFGENLHQLQTVFKTMFLGGPVACFAGASIGTASLYLTGTVVTDDLLLQWWNYWVGDTVGVLVVLPLVFLWGQELRRTSVRTRLGVALPVIATIALTGIAAYSVRAGERQAARAEFERRAELMAQTLEPIALQHLDIVRSVASLFETNGKVTREGFRSFVRPIFTRHTDLHGLSWNAVVPSDERASFEERARLDGYPEFRFTERDPSGKLVAAGERDQYVIVTFIEPYEGNERALGYDLASDAVRKQALDRARDSGKVMATPPIRLVQEAEDKPGFLFFAPVYAKGSLPPALDERRQALGSFVSGVFKAETLIADAFRAFAEEGIAYRVLDSSDPDQPHLLDSVGWQVPLPEGPLADLDWSTSFGVAGRQWTLLLRPRPTYETAAGRSTVWAVLTGGLVFSSLLGVFLLVSVGRTTAAERASAALRHEIQERQLAESERKKLQEQVQQSQKLESLGVLAGGIAHDFNNLLMGVLGHADLALMKLDPDAPVRANIRSIEIASQRGAELANQLLAYSGKGRFVIETINFSELVAEISNLVEVSASKTNRVEFNLANDLPAVKADPTQMRQVVLNLITNASEALADTNGTITLTTGVEECDSDYLSSNYAATATVPGTYVFVEVADTGCGMDEETRSKIFDPFFTTKFTGRGLGLAAVLGIIRSHDGAIDVQSEPGRGTTVRVLLPASDESVRSSTPREPPKPSWRGGGLVLLVDDDPTVRAVVKEMLNSLGFAILVAEDGVEAVNVYRQRADQIRLVILDLAMPRMGGERTFSALREIRQDVKVIISSGYDEGELTAKFRGKGLAGFIHKPFRLAPLRDVLRQALSD